jgi:hypothetical protein
MSRRRPKKYIVIDEVKEIYDIDGNRYLVRRILSSDGVGNLVVEDLHGRIISIKVSPAEQKKEDKQFFKTPLPA